jgi:hypothetical protein
MMNENKKQLIAKLYVAARDRSYRDAADKKGDAVSWRIEKEGWFSVRCLSVQEYSPNVFRFKNSYWGNIPKSLWPFSSYPKIESMDIRVHSNELDQGMIELLLKVAENPKSKRKDKRFPNGVLNADSWSEMARKQYEQNLAKQKR